MSWTSNPETAGSASSTRISTTGPLPPVLVERSYALECKEDEFDPPEIKPIILERPPSPPWPELAHMHFNDPVVHFVRAED
jgi:hypothetical protein